MTRGYGAIPTRVLGITFRSRLEAKWAVLFTIFGWRFEYEPIDLAAFKIPDFVIYSMYRPTIIECKPAVTVGEVDAYRAILQRAAQPWILADLEDHRRALDDDDSATVSEVDAVLADIARVEAGEHPLDGRRALVVGSQLFIDDSHDACSLDGRHYLTDCHDHVGLIEPQIWWKRRRRGCLACSDESPRLMRSRDALIAWRDAADKSRWEPTS